MAYSGQGVHSKEGGASGLPMLPSDEGRRKGGNESHFATIPPRSNAKQRPERGAPPWEKTQPVIETLWRDREGGREKKTPAAWSPIYRLLRSKEKKRGGGALEASGQEVFLLNNREKESNGPPPFSSAGREGGGSAAVSSLISLLNFKREGGDHAGICRSIPPSSDYQPVGEGE